jgi:vancomycin resistance protein YoaR
VRNIHRAADLLRHRIVLPGQRFSLNEALGPRTPERGFVRAPVINQGEFSEDVGGGVSQLATTTFNAIFFGGYPILHTSRTPTTSPATPWAARPPSRCPPRTWCSATTCGRPS